MEKYMLLALQNATLGNDEAFVRWFDQQHIPDLLRVEGIVAAQLYRTSDQQLPGMNPTHQYACLYEVETEDLGKCINDMMRRANTDNMPHSATLDYKSIHAVYFKPVTARVARDALA